MMLAVIQDKYDALGQLRVSEVNVPKPTQTQVLVKMEAAGVHADVWHVVTGYPLVLRLFGSGIRRPHPATPGTDVAGVVCGLGPGVSAFQIGDRVFGEAHQGLQWKNGGTFAEFVAADVRALVKIPDKLSFQEAATLPTAGHIALTNLEGASELGPSSEVLINGAAGAVGSIAVAYALARGSKVTAIDAGNRLAGLLERGVGQVLDYQKGQLPLETQKYDLVFDVASTLPTKLALGLLKPSGKYVIIGHDHFGKKGQPLLGEIPRLMGLTFRSLFQPKLRVSMANLKKGQSMEILCELVESGHLKPEVARSFPLEQVNEAMALLASSTAEGRIVLVPSLG